MKQPSALLKVAAITSAVVLVGGLIAFRAGAFDTPVLVNPPTVETPPEPTPVSTEAYHDPSVVDPSIMLSTSKSAGVVIPVPPPKADEPKPSAPKTIIGGSKSLAPLLPPKSAEPKAPSTPPR
ncbi:MAG TPA: hypothetical protein VHR66_07765 [Gemmataceae bacterium]|jgi:hypothetical protein|nr:hypothetical protein [Gemmataceae bacterium]